MSVIEIVHTRMLLGRVAVARIHTHRWLHHRVLVLVRILMVVKPWLHHLLGVVVQLLLLMLLLLIDLLVILLVVL